MANHLHFLMVPLNCPGHLIPMLDMAKMLAQRAVMVTIVITPRNAIRFGAAIRRAVEAGLPIRILEIPFPSLEAGLPEGCESVDEMPSFNFASNFFVASQLLQQPVEEMFRELEPSPSCIISDKHLLWTADTAKRYHIPWIIFDGMSCFTQLCTHNLFVSKIHETMSNSEPFVVPDLPDCIQLTKAQLPPLFNPGSPNLEKIREQIRAAESGAYGVVINSFEELEQRYVDEFRKVKRGKVWCIGPLSLSNKNDLDKSERGNSDSSEEHDRCLRWLDSWQQQGSVIYACLGSLTRLVPLQFKELALGLEASNSPFILVQKKAAGSKKSQEIDKWILEDGFEKRMKGRGLVIRGWAPQVLILSHPAIGGFLTHCGWNSTLEGICARVPMATWPVFAEQFLNEKLVVQVLGTGIGVGADAVVHPGEEEKAGVNVRREDVRKAINRVMDAGKEGEERRKGARMLGNMAKMAIEEGGSSHLSMTLLIQDIQHYNLQTNSDQCASNT